MAKKKKKKAQAKKIGTPAPKPAQPAPKPAVKVPERLPQRVDLRKEYPYVYSDLKRAGITALVMLIFMLILSVIIH